MKNKLNRVLIAGFVLMIVFMSISLAKPKKKIENKSIPNESQIEDNKYFYNYLDSMNNKELSKLTSWKITGRIQSNGLSTNNFEFYYLKPDCLRLYIYSNDRIVYSTDGTDEYYKNGTMPTLKLGANHKAFLRYFATAIEGPASDFYSNSLNLKFINNDSVGGKKVARYDVSDKTGLTKEFNIEQANNLLYKLVFTDQIMEFSFPIDLYFNTYKRFDEVLYPYNFEIYQNDMTSNITINEVFPNYGLNKSDFKRPYSGY